jgi:hypothetical protein
MSALPCKYCGFVAPRMSDEDCPAKPRAPRGTYRGGGYSIIQGPGFFRATGEWRAPKRGEWYLSGAVIEAYQALQDLDGVYWIAQRIPDPPREIHAHGLTYRRS